MFIYFGLAALEVGAAYRFWGWSGAWLQGGQGVLAVTLFEAVNYIEHYGLERVDKSELVQHRHSWDADAKLTGAHLLLHPVLLLVLCPACAPAPRPYCPRRRVLLLIPTC